MCLSTAIQIRPASAADNAALKGLEAVIDGAFRSYSDCDNPGTSVAPPRDIAADAPRAASARRLVLEWSGIPLAALRWTPHAAPADAPGHAVIVDLFAVAEGFRIAGFARRLLAAAETDMRRAGCGSIEITAPLDALPALTRLGLSPHPASAAGAGDRRNLSGRTARQGDLIPRDSSIDARRPAAPPGLITSFKSSDAQD